MNKVLILGGYGNFGCRIACALAKDNIAIIIAGRDQHKADTLAKNLQKKYPHSTIETAIFDAKLYLPIHLKKLNPRIVINTAGPFQNSDYSIAKACIAQHIHYIDLADGRDFVREISSLNLAAQAANTLVISGASTVPALSSAVLEKYKHAFSTIDSLVFGISPGQKAHRGLATTAGILSYIGKQLKNSKDGKVRYGWQDMYRIKYPE